MNETLNSLSKLIKITETLMGDDGCPWDKVQTRESLKPYLVEETYEVLEALDENDPKKIKDELGDLLYQILFHSKISSLKGEFNFRDVIDNLSEKMVRRHPHVFNGVKLDTPDQVIGQWEEIKKKENNKSNQKSILDSVPKNLPSLIRAQKLQKKAAKEGFDWEQINDVFDKLDEEIIEFKEAVLKKKNPDILYKVDAEEALRSTNNKFIKRFQYIEQKIKEKGETLKDCPLEEMERYWQEAKKR